MWFPKDNKKRKKDNKKEKLLASFSERVYVLGPCHDWLITLGLYKAYCTRMFVKKCTEQGQSECASWIIFLKCVCTKKARNLQHVLFDYYAHTVFLCT